jgi:restriction system protein
MHTPKLSAFNAFDIFLPLLLDYWWVLLLILALKIFRLPSSKGWFGEMLVNRALKRLPVSDYTIFHDIYLPRPDGAGTTQVDHLAVSRFGIFVIETKNYQGWILGSEKQRRWTQRINKRNYPFQNPLHQNQLHINALKEFLKLAPTQFHNVIYFVGDCTLKTDLPDNVMTSGLLRWIKNQQEILLSEEELEQTLKTLRQHIASYDKQLTAKQHKLALQSRLKC